MEKKKSYLKMCLMINLIIILIGLSGFFLFRYAYPQAMLVPGLGIQTKNIVWDGINVELKSTNFGGITSGPSTGDICTDNDGHITLSNSYGSGNAFSLSSSQTGSDPCNYENGIEAKMIVPAGKIAIGYSNNNGLSPIGRGSQIASRSKVTIMDGLTTLFNDDVHIPARMGSASSSKNFEITFDTPTEIIVSASTWGPGGGGHSSASISFELIDPTPIPPEPNPEYCGDDICNNDETKQTCSIDCGEPSDPDPEPTLEEPKLWDIPLVNLISGIVFGLLVILIITMLIVRRRK